MKFKELKEKAEKLEHKRNFRHNRDFKTGWVEMFRKKGFSVEINESPGLKDKVIETDKHFVCLAKQHAAYPSSRLYQWLSENEGGSSEMMGRVSNSNNELVVVKFNKKEAPDFIKEVVR